MPRIHLRLTSPTSKWPFPFKQSNQHQPSQLEVGKNTNTSCRGDAIGHMRMCVAKKCVIRKKSWLNLKLSLKRDQPSVWQWHPFSWRVSGSRLKPPILKPGLSDTHPVLRFGGLLYWTDSDVTAKQMAVKQNQPRMPVLRSTAVGPPIKEMFDSAPSVVNLNMSMISEETHTHKHS